MYTPPIATNVEFDFTVSGYRAPLAPLFIFSLGPAAGQVEARLDGVSAEIVGSILPPVHRFFTINWCAPVDQAANDSVRTEAPKSQSLVTAVTHCSSQEISLPLDQKLCSPIDQGVPVSGWAHSLQDSAIPLWAKACAPTDVLDFTVIESCAPYDQAVWLPGKYVAQLEGLIQLNDDDVCAVYFDASATRHLTKSHYIAQLPAYTPTRQIDLGYSDSSSNVYAAVLKYAGQNPLEFRFTDNGYIPPAYPTMDIGYDNIEEHQYAFDVHSGSPGLYVPTSTLTTDYTSQLAVLTDSDQDGLLRTGRCSPSQQSAETHAKLCSPVDETVQPQAGTTTWVDPPRPDPDPNPPSGETIVVPKQEAYTMQNSILVTLDDGVTPIEMSKVLLSLDADGFTWTFSGDLLVPSDKAKVTPAEDGSPVVLYIGINGYFFHVIVEKTRVRRTFSSSVTSVSGRGINSLLSKPYIKPQSVTFGSDATVQQLVDSILPVGWTAVWNCANWIVDGGAYGYAGKTPMEALKGIADDIGAALVPTRDAQEISFQPRYKVMPWSFSATAADIVIPHDAILEITEEPLSSYQGNGIYIHGNEVGGELAFVRLAGSAGDRLLPTVNNSLMTDPAGLRALGERHLAAQAKQPSIKGIKTFMDGVAIPMANIGDLVEITGDAESVKGIVNSVSIEATTTTVWQTLVFGETTINPWVAFADILPKDPMLVATLTSTDGIMSIMLLLDGGVVRVRGTGAVNGKYYIRSGEIVGPAPDQVLSLIVV